MNKEHVFLQLSHLTSWELTFGALESLRLIMNCCNMTFKLTFVCSRIRTTIAPEFKVLFRPVHSFNVFFEMRVSPKSALAYLALKRFHLFVKNLTCFFTAEMDERVFSQIGQTEDISAANRLSSVQRPSGSWRKLVNETLKCDQIFCQYFLRIFLLHWLSKMTSNRRTCVFALIRWSPQSIKQINIWLFLQQRSGNCILISL